MKLAARLAEMVLYDIPNVKLPFVQVDIYSAYRDDDGSAQRCILSATCSRETGRCIWTGTTWARGDHAGIRRALPAR